MLALAAKAEFDKFVSSLQGMYQASGAAMLRYERALCTKGRDHMQEHIVPVPHIKVSGALSAFMRIAGEFNLKFSEIQVRFPIFI